ncbi:hypothetical protein, partial [Lentimonas sp. CC19]
MLGTLQSSCSIPFVPHFMSTLHVMQKELKSIGYWKERYSSEQLHTLKANGNDVEELQRYPEPLLLVGSTWKEEKKKRIILYLNSGHRWSEQLGYSYCRFECGIAESSMGNSCLTDSTWIWPEGLSHYVEEHDITLPDEFIRHMEDRNWKAEVEEHELESLRKSRPSVNDDFWLGWSSSFKSKEGILRKIKSITSQSYQRLSRSALQAR